MKVALLLVIFLFGIAGLVYLLFFAGLFEVKTISVRGNTIVPTTDIERPIRDWLDQKKFGIARKSNSLLFSLENLRAIISANISTIDSIKSSRTSLHEIIFEVTERKAVGIWCFQPASACYLFDKHGTIYGQTFLTDGLIYITVKDFRSREIKIGDSIADEFYRNILLAKEELVKAGLTVIEFSIPENSFAEFHAKVIGENAPFLVKLSQMTNIPEQINSLSLFLKKTSGSTRALNFEYIDLRIQDRIYYK